MLALGTVIGLGIFAGLSLFQQGIPAQQVASSARADVYAKKTGALKDLADKAVSVIYWTPEGRGRGTDLVAAVKNVVQNMKNRGVVPANATLNIEDAVDVRFLP